MSLKVTDTGKYYVPITFINKDILSELIQNNPELVNLTLWNTDKHFLITDNIDYKICAIQDKNKNDVLFIKTFTSYTDYDAQVFLVKISVPKLSKKFNLLINDFGITSIERNEKLHKFSVRPTANYQRILYKQFDDDYIKALNEYSVNQERFRVRKTITTPTEKEILDTHLHDMIEENLPSNLLKK